jgi:hypothetical protein
MIASLYNGTEADINELKAQVKSFASPESVIEELLEHVFRNGVSSQLSRGGTIVLG